MEQKIPRGIRKRGDKYLVSVTHKGKRQYKTCVTLAEAAEERRKMKVALAGEAKKQEKRQITYGEAYKMTVKAYWSDTKGGATAIRQAKDSLEYFGEESHLDTITTERLDAFIGTLQERGNKNATVNRKLSALSKILSTAFERGYLKNKPVIPFKKEPAGRIRFLSDAEEERLLTLMQEHGTPEHVYATVLLIETGMRIGELLRLEARDIDLENNTISIWITKTDRPRSLPMTSRAREAVEELINRSELGPLVPHSYAWFKIAWQKVRAEMGLLEDPYFTPHVLRHTCCSRLVQRGVQLRHVQTWMGHTSIQTTVRYAHLAPQDLKACAVALEDKRKRPA